MLKQKPAFSKNRCLYFVKEITLTIFTTFQCFNVNLNIFLLNLNDMLTFYMFYAKTRCFREAYTGLPVVRVTEIRRH